MRPARIILAMGATPRTPGRARGGDSAGPGRELLRHLRRGLLQGPRGRGGRRRDTACEDAPVPGRAMQQGAFDPPARQPAGGAGAPGQGALHENIQMHWNSRVAEVLGEKMVSGLRLQDGAELPVSGVFVAVGLTPQTALADGQLPLAGGYIRTDEAMDTGVPGVFAAGDLREKPLRQVITAVADGAVAAVSASGTSRRASSPSTEQVKERFDGETVWNRRRAGRGQHRVDRADGLPAGPGRSLRAGPGPPRPPHPGGQGHPRQRRYARVRPGGGHLLGGGARRSSPG